MGVSAPVTRGFTPYLLWTSLPRGLAGGSDGLTEERQRAWAALAVVPSRVIVSLAAISIATRLRIAMDRILILL